MGLMIETFGLTRKFANLTALEDLSIQARKGEILRFGSDYPGKRRSGPGTVDGLVLTLGD